MLKNVNWQFEDLLPILKNSEHIFPNFYKMMKIALILPVSIATCERWFSVVRRIKNWLRSLMTYKPLH